MPEPYVIDLLGIDTLTGKNWLAIGEESRRDDIRKKAYAKWRAKHFNDAYNPDEPRDPHGEWTSGGGAGAVERGRAPTAGQAERSGPSAGVTGVEATSVAYRREAAAGPSQRGTVATWTAGKSSIQELSGDEGAKRFRDAIEAAKAANPHGAAVALHSLDDYKGMRLFMAPDGKAGFALHGDEIVSVFKDPHSKLPHWANSALQLAVQEGGRRLDAFDTVLPHIYSRSGFRAVARTAFDENYKPDGWKHEDFAEYNGGKPDVVFMVHDPAGNKPYQGGDGVRVADYDAGTKVQQAEVERLKSLTNWTKIGGGSTGYSNGKERLDIVDHLSHDQLLTVRNDVKALNSRADEFEHPYSGNRRDIHEYSAISMISAAAHLMMAAPTRIRGAYLLDSKGHLQGAVAVDNKHNGVGEIAFLGTLKQGMGAHLLKMGETIAREHFGAKQVQLASLPDARGFYERHGYTAKPGSAPDDMEYIKSLQDAAHAVQDEPPYLWAGDLDRAIEIIKQHR